MAGVNYSTGRMPPSVRSIFFVKPYSEHPWRFSAGRSSIVLIYSRSEAVFLTLTMPFSAPSLTTRSELI